MNKKEVCIVILVILLLINLVCAVLHIREEKKHEQERVYHKNHYTVIKRQLPPSRRFARSVASEHSPRYGLRPPLESCSVKNKNQVRGRQNGNWSDRASPATIKEIC